MSRSNSTNRGKNRVEMTGKRFGRLTVTGYSHSDKRWQAHWNCRCDCGKALVVQGSCLRSGNSKSCGCLRDESRLIHGFFVGRKANKNHRLGSEYRTYLKMKERCYKEYCPQYKDYGGRGIKVCDRWIGRDGFVRFYADMGPKPSPAHTIERVNNNGNYEPGNCKWATRKEQARNSRGNRLITHNGKTQCMSAWAEEFGVTYATFQSRVSKGGVQFALRLGGRKGGRGGVYLREMTRLITYRGETRPLGTWARLFNLARGTLAKRLEKGMSVEKALNTPTRSRKWQK